VVGSFAFHEKEFPSIICSILIILFFLLFLSRRKIFVQQILSIFDIQSFFQRNEPIELRFARNLFKLILQGSIVSISINYVILSESIIVV